MNKNLVNRRKLGLITSISAVVVAVTEGLLSIIRTREILFAFGDSTNAIMQVAVQLTAYLVLIESGMTAAYQLRLYKPLKDGDDKEISSLYMGLKKNLRDIVLKMLVVVNVCSFVYVFFLLNTNESRTYAFAIFFVMGLRFILPYMFLLQEKTILIASERGYVATLIQGFFQCVTMAIEIVLCKYTSLPLYIVLLPYIILVILTKFLYILYRKNVLQIKVNSAAEPDLRPKEMTRDILAHQISGMISSNTDNILLSVMSSLKDVTIYSSYNTVVAYPTSLFNSIVSNMKASVIIKIQNKDKNAFATYENVLKMSCLLMALTTSVFYAQINKFIELWIGEQYILASPDVIMFSVLLFTEVVFNVLTIGIDAKGLYKETKHIAIMQASTNFILTILLIPKYGITGALIGTVISRLGVKYPLMSHIVYNQVFCTKDNSYLVIGSGLICTALSALIGFAITNLWTVNTWCSFIISTLASCLGCALFIFIWYMIFDRQLVHYIFGNVKKR